LPLRGYKYEYDQDQEFPRIIDEQIVGDPDENAVVPDLVKHASMEEALAIYLAGTGGRRAMQEQGVQSFSLGKLSESFMPGIGLSTMQSLQAKAIMKRYTGAVVR
jgi:hypothetical protein